MLPQVLKILKIPPAQLTDQVTCARIIEPRQRSRHFCCHRTFLCWHALRSCSVQCMVPWSMLPFLSTDSPPTKNGTAFRRLSLSAERKLLYSGHCETSTSLPCHALPKLREEEPRREETRLGWRRTHWSGPASAAAGQTRQALLWAAIAISICQALQLHFTKLLFKGKRQSNKM